MTRFQQLTPLPNANEYCDRYFETIQCYLERGTNVKEMEELRFHCARCVVCEHAIQAEEELSRLLKDTRYITAPNTLRHRITLMFSGRVHRGENSNR